MSNGINKFIKWPYSPNPTNGQIIKYNESSEYFEPADDDSIHDNVAGEINAISEKTSIHDNDLLIIEDSENSNNKKKAKISNIAKSVSKPLMCFAVEGESQDYVEHSSTSWLVAQSFIFPGTSVFIPTIFSFIGSRNNDSGTCTCRLYDMTNDTVIASVTYSSESKTIYTDNSLQNLPSNQAIFEIQIKMDATNASKIRFHSCILR